MAQNQTPQKAGLNRAATPTATLAPAKPARPIEATTPATAPPEAEPADEEPSTTVSQWLRESPSWLVSLIVHMLLLLILALWMLPSQIEDLYANLSVTPTEEMEEEFEEIIEPPEELDIDVSEVVEVQPQVETENVQEQAMITDASDVEAAAVSVELQEFSTETAPKSDLLTAIGSVTGSGLSGRGTAARAALVKQGGGNPASEKAVALALRWLAAHQLQDGGWSFDHRIGQCQGRCPNEGHMATARNGATALALLPFLGAGQTHKEGEYQRVVGAGLYYLVRSMKVGPSGGDLMDAGGRMYSHGLASIVLCEAYGMTQDNGLARPAQAALNFIVTAQDPVGGGWRYTPKMAGDTSAVGWQIMALKSGHMGYLQVPQNTVKGASVFLDSVQADSGSAYGYTGPGAGSATTAVGLLSRMYLGWKKDHPALERGVQTMAAAGPSKSNLYRDYYAAQVMFQATGAKGEMWEKWNTELRDHLVATQSQVGHTTGSWFVKGGDHGTTAGGRVYCTAMSTLILEVYYRHMPIFKDMEQQEEFPD